jgi:phage baseplate assembly protein gpV
VSQTADRVVLSWTASATDTAAADARRHQRQHEFSRGTSREIDTSAPRLHEQGWLRRSPRHERPATRTLGSIASRVDCACANAAAKLRGTDHGSSFPVLR